MIGDPLLRDQIGAFLEFLKYNRNVSPHTLRAYETDLTQLLACAAPDAAARWAVVAAPLTCGRVGFT